MIIRKCPECNNRISLFRTLNLCPCRSYTCPHCSIKLTISETSHQILLYGALLILLPTLVYFVAEPSQLSGAALGLAFLFLVVLTVATQKIIHAKT